MKKIAISIGDLNGIGIQLALENHDTIKEKINPLYCIDEVMLKQASELLNLPIPSDFNYTKKFANPFTIQPSQITKASGVYSFASFLKAVELVKMGDVDGIMTLPIHKKAWELAGVHFKGHTDALREFFFTPAIMMLGSPKMYVALYTEHIPLHQVPKEVKNVEKLSQFLIDFYENIKMDLNKNEKIGLLGLNPHAGDDGVLGDEEQYIIKAREIAHKSIGKVIYSEPLVPDVAFTPNSRKNYRYFVAMYHDQGLAPLKALYFDEGINISLNLPIIRTSVDHGTAFDIAYKNSMLNNLSYLNAIDYFETT
ncbi:4-hydroxythreonine-4-phosphate dehydrogenase [bacterium]|nr:4-hydroxythreonine-4-phosphate dehydrogenase [bacterium]MBU1957743.1 4-hydroxythreonine-4-phosphate dehydrogenase [bacterium]